MKYILTAFLIAIVCTHSYSQKKENESITTFYFIRHAEKDRNDKTNQDPHLTEVGKARAEHWNVILKSITFDVVFSTDYHRTRETALPIAKRNNLEITIYDPKLLDIEKLKQDHRGNNILVVGHSNTTPFLVNKLLGNNKYEAIDDSNNGNLYIITFTNDTVSDILLEINLQ